MRLECVPTLTSLPVLEYIFKKYTIRCRNIICIYLLLILNLEHNSTLPKVHTYLCILSILYPKKLKCINQRAWNCITFFYLPNQKCGVLNFRNSFQVKSSKFSIKSLNIVSFHAFCNIQIYVRSNIFQPLTNLLLISQLMKFANKCKMLT